MYTAMKEPKALHVEMTFFDQRHKGPFKAKSATKGYNSLIRILDEATIIGREEQHYDKWKQADKRHLERFHQNAPAKPAAPAPHSQPGMQVKGKGTQSGKGNGESDGQNGKDKPAKTDGQVKGGRCAPALC